MDRDVRQVQPALVQILQAPDTRGTQEEDLIRLRDVAHLSLEAHSFTMRAVAVFTQECGDVEFTRGGRGEGCLGVTHGPAGRQADTVLRSDDEHGVRVRDDILKGQVYLRTLRLEDVLERVLRLIQFLYNSGYSLS